MKKMRILCVSVLALGLAFIATSCKKDKQTTQFTVSTCALEEDDDTRVYLDFGDRNRMKWSANDAIMIYNLVPDDGDAAIIQEFHTDEAAEGQVTANFYGPSVGAPQSEAGYFFFYPAEMTTATVNADNCATFTVGDTQKYTELKNSKGYRITTIEPGTMAQATQSSNLNFTMQNLFGIARIYMTGNATVTKVELIDSHLALTGSAEVCLPNVDAAVLQTYVNDYKQGNISYLDCYQYAVNELLYMPHPTGNMVTMNCAYTYEGESFEGVQLTNPDAKSFMFCLRPGALSQGFTVKVYFDDHTGRIIDMYANTDNLENPRKYCIVPGRIQAIKFLDADGFFIDVDGVDANGNPIFTPFEW